MGRFFFWMFMVFRFTAIDCEMSSSHPFLVFPRGLGLGVFWRGPFFFFFCALFGGHILVSFFSSGSPQKLLTGPIPPPSPFPSTQGHPAHWLLSLPRPGSFAPNAPFFCTPCPSSPLPQDVSHVAILEKIPSPLSSFFPSSPNGRPTPGKHHSPAVFPRKWTTSSFFFYVFTFERNHGKGPQQVTEFCPNEYLSPLLTVSRPRSTLNFHPYPRPWSCRVHHFETLPPPHSKNALTPRLASAGHGACQLLTLAI